MLDELEGWRADRFRLAERCRARSRRLDPQMRIVNRAAAFLAALTEDEREEATWPFDDDERRDVHFAPIGLDGIRHGDLTVAAPAAADGLLKVDVVRSRVREGERHSAARTRRRATGIDVPPTARVARPGAILHRCLRHPAETQPWAFRYEGHHLSINVTRCPGEQAVTTPLFLGAQPREVPAGMPSAGVAALGEEERVIRALYTSLDAGQRASATLKYEEDRGHMIGQVPRLAAPASIGLARSAMRPAQQELLDALLERFAGFWAEPIAAARRHDIDAARATLHFAHVQSEEPANAFYTRVSGAGFCSKSTTRTAAITCMRSGTSRVEISATTCSRVTLRRPRARDTREDARDHTGARLAAAVQRAAPTARRRIQGSKTQSRSTTGCYLRQRQTGDWRVVHFHCSNHVPGQMGGL